MLCKVIFLDGSIHKHQTGQYSEIMKDDCELWLWRVQLILDVSVVAVVLDEQLLRCLPDAAQDFIEIIAPSLEAPKF